MKISVVDFSKRGKEFHGVVGLCDFEDKQIWVDKRLPKTATATREIVKNHEKAHYWLHRKHLRRYFTPAKEETACELLALIWTGDKYLTDAEIAAKKYILRGRTWRNERGRIFDDICVFLRVGIKAVRMA